MKVTVIRIVISVLVTVPKILLRELKELEIGEQVVTIQITSLKRSARILRSILET